MRTDLNIQEKFIVALIEDLQNNLGMMSEDEIWDALESMLEVMFADMDEEE